MFWGLVRALGFFQGKTTPNRWTRMIAGIEDERARALGFRGPLLARVWGGEGGSYYLQSLDPNVGFYLDTCSRKGVIYPIRL